MTAVNDRTRRISGLFRALRRVSLGALTAQVVAFPSFADTVFPPHALVKDNPRGTCRITLLPTLASGPAAPRLVVDMPNGSKRDRFGLRLASDAAVVEAQTVFDNARDTFTPISATSGSAMARRSVWVALAAAYKDEKPISFTVRHPSGDYSSALYEGLDPIGIVSILETQCAYTSPVLTSISKTDRLRVEQGLRLSTSDVRKIRWVLNARYGNKYREPSRSSTLTARDRDYLGRYTEDKGLPISRYLTQGSANRLLVERFSAAQPKLSGSTSQRRFDDWLFYRRTNECYVETAATTWSGFDFYVRPIARFSATRNQSGAGMNIALVRPNPFRTSASIKARVHAWDIPLRFGSGRILPMQERGVPSKDIVKGFQAGREVAFIGTSQESGRSALVRFSAIGFTAAFSHLQNVCNRAGLSAWLR